MSDVVGRMNAALHHRGPDDAGQFSVSQCSIAMRRLAIIDLVTGHQPMSNEDGSLHIVFNGEIYNYPELREVLVKSGRHQFQASGDTEVLLHLYEDHGREMLPMLHGMFAFCIYDERTDSLFIARDRFGEKPLFYTIVDGALAFSSELASLLEWDAIERTLDAEALYYYLHNAFVPTPLTMFKNVYQLPPGHWLHWQAGKLEIGSYFQPDFAPDADLLDEEVAKAAVRDQLLRAVRSQMISDVPLGAFLSGGIDSSAIVAAMQRQSSKPVKTFTVRFEYAPYDESPIARTVAEHLGTEHHEFVITNASFNRDDLDRIVRHVGQPFTDSSAIPTYFITREIRQHVTVALSGDGGDEMFGGYDYFRWMMNVDRLAQMVPQPALSLADQALQAAARYQLPDMGVLRKARRATEIARHTPVKRLTALGTIFEHRELDALLADAGVDQAIRNGHNRLHQMMLATSSMSRLRQMMYYRMGFSLPHDMLVKVDRMSMANSLEVRAPMLSVELSSLAMRLPDELLIKDGMTKYILREAVRDWLPDVVFSHPKSGFSIPLHHFQNADYAQACQELLLIQPPALIRQLFSSSQLQSIVERGLTQKSDTATASVYRTSHQIWSLLQLASWAQMFGVGL